MVKSSELTNPQLVVWAIARQGGVENSVDVEDIAVELETLCPGRFGWRKYPERIDLDSVRVACRDAKKPKNGGLVIGDNIGGWMLTAAGRRWLESQSTVAGRDVTRPRRNSPEALLEDERLRLRQTEAYRLFMIDKADQITRLDYFQFARINEYFNDKAKTRRFGIIEKAVRADPQLNALWAYLSDRY